MTQTITGHRHARSLALGFEPMFLGHQPTAVLEAVRRQLDRGLGYGACHTLEAGRAEAVCRTVPSAEVCVFSNAGSEAAQVALLLAEGVHVNPRGLPYVSTAHTDMDLEQAREAVHPGAIAATNTGRAESFSSS